MQVLAISAKYPTLFQSWFVNYLASLEQLNVELSIFSLSKGEERYHPKINELSTTLTWTVRKGFFSDILSAALFIAKNSLHQNTYSYIFSSLKNSKNIKCGLREALMVCGIKVDANIIHCHSEKAAVRLLPLLKRFNVPITLTFHGLPPEGVPDITQEERELLYSYLSCVFVNTQFAKDQCNVVYGRPVFTKIVPQGIDFSDFPFKPVQNGDQEPTIVLTVGRLDRLKGHLYAINAIKMLNEKGFNIEYWVVGAGLYQPEIEKEIELYGLFDTVKILGSRTGNELVSIYHAAHIFLLPSQEEPGSWAETQGIVIQEAQACGVLTIATNTGGIPECIIDGETGFLVEQKSAKAISDKIEFLLNNQERWGTWRHAARKHVEKHFDYRDMGRRLVESYEEILEQS